jgi:hypothetical protein
MDPKTKKQLTCPERIRQWVGRNVRPAYRDDVFDELLDAATGNRPATPYHSRVLASIFPESPTPGQ